jgi:hypothetical protein
LSGWAAFRLLPGNHVLDDGMLNQPRHTPSTEDLNRSRKTLAELGAGERIQTADLPLTRRLCRDLPILRAALFRRTQVICDFGSRLFSLVHTVSGAHVPRMCPRGP